MPAKINILDDILSRKKPRTATATIVLDGEFVDRWNEARAEFRRTKLAYSGIASDENREAFAVAEAEMEQLRPQLDEAIIEFKFRALGRQPYEDLLDEYPPTEAQKLEAKKKGEPVPPFNVDTFPPVLISASLVEPQMSADDVDALFNSDKFNDPELGLIFGTAIDVNRTTRIVDLGKD